MTAQVQLPYTVFRQLAREGVPLASSADFGEGMAAARWLRDEVAETRYPDPGHHTLSLYAAGGGGIRRRQGRRELRSRGAGTLCIMPAGETTDWLVSGEVDLFHLYIPRALFERTALQADGRDPATVELPERPFFADPWLERAIRTTFLDMDWDEPADRLALSQSGQRILEHVLRHYTPAGPRAPVRGGLSPTVRRRVQDYIETHLDRPLVLDELAGVAALSPYHFARMFKQTTGEAPHAYVLRRRVARARRLLVQERRRPITVVAAACGFSSQSHFTASFRRLTGVTPRRYRVAAGAGAGRVG